MNCKNCYYDIESDYIFCPSCGTKISEYSIEPSTRELLLFEGGVHEFVVTNNGMASITVNGCSDPNFTIDQPQVIESGESRKITVKYPSRLLGDTGYFSLDISPSLGESATTFDYRVVEKPTISFTVDNAVEKDDIWYISETNAEKIVLELDSSCDIELLEYKINGTSDGHQQYELKLNSLQHNYNTHFEFDLLGGTDLSVGNMLSFEVEFFFQGLVVQKRIDIEVSSVSTLRFEAEETEHNTPASKDNLSPTTLEIIEGTKHLYDTTLKFSVNGGALRIIDVEFPNTITLASNGSQHHLPQSIVSSISTIIGKEFNEGEMVELNLEVNPLIIPENLKDVLYDDIANFEVLVSTEDVTNNFRSTAIANLSFILTKRESVSISVDYGTSNTCIAFIPNDSDELVPRLATFRFGVEELTEVPSLIKFDKFYDEEGEKLPFLSEEVEIGPQVANFANSVDASATTHNSIAWGFKSLLSQPNKEMYFSDSQSRTSRYTPKQLVTLFINQLIVHFEATNPYRVTEINVTYPAAFSPFEKKVLTDAIYDTGRFAEGKVHLTLSEPVALAAHYACSFIDDPLDEDLEPGDIHTIAVFDCGGGTTDLTIAKLECDDDDIKTLSFLASDGIFTQNRETTIGGNYLHYCIAKGLYTIIDNDEIPFISSFKLPFELANEEESLKYNSSYLFYQAEKIKKRDLPFGNLEFTVKNNMGGENDESIEFKESDEEKALIDELVYSLSQVNVMLYLLEGKNNTGRNLYLDSFLFPKTKYVEEIEDLDTLLEYGATTPEIKTAVVFAKDVFLEVFTYTETSPESLKMVARKEGFGHFDDVAGYLNTLVGKNKIESLFVDKILLIGYDEHNVDEINEISETQSKAQIEHFSKKVDSLIVGGNSSRHPLFKELAKELISAEKYIIAEPWAKSGVVLGACRVNMASDGSLPFDIEQSSMLPYSIGYMLQGKFVALLDQWQDITDITSKQSRPRKVSTRTADRTIFIFENRDISNPKPRLQPHNKILQPIVGTITVPDSCIGSYITFSLSMTDDGQLCYTIYSSPQKTGEFEAVETKLLHGDDK